MQIGAREMGGMLLACLAIAWLAHGQMFALDEQIALSGFSILEVLAAQAVPEAFERDYPGGARLTTAFSPVVYLYLAGQDLGLAPMAMLYGMILLELGTMVWGLWLLWGALLDRCAAQVTRGQSGAWDGVVRLGFVMLVSVVLTSSVQLANMVNFGFPFYHGQFYGYADGLRLAAIAMVLRRRWELAALAFLAAFAIHPIKSALAAAFALGLLAIDWREAVRFRALLAIGATLAGWVGWYALVLRSMGEDVPLDAFIAYTRAQQSHWYPVDLGLLSTWHTRGLSPFMALLLSGLVALRQPGWQPGLRAGILAGMAILVLLTAAGIWISVDASSAMLIRICLARASNLVSLAMPVILVAGAVFAWRDGRILMAAGFLGFLAVGFEFPEGPRQMAPVFALALAGVHLLQQPRDARVVLPLAIPVAVTTVWLASAYPKAGDPLLAAVWPFLAGAMTWGILALQNWSAPAGHPGPKAATPAWLALVTLFLIGAMIWTAQRVHRTEAHRSLARAYKETQLWAHAETPVGSLFMVDPCRWYGWRDFSHRASIGTTLEWYMTAWIYSGRGDLLRRGQEIGETLGLDMAPDELAPRSNATICKAARAVYYAPDLAGPRRVAQRFDIDYFIFEKAHSSDIPTSIAMRYVFENTHFAVLPASELKP